MITLDQVNDKAEAAWEIRDFLMLHSDEDLKLTKDLINDFDKLKEFLEGHGISEALTEALILQIKWYFLDQSLDLGISEYYNSYKLNLFWLMLRNPTAETYRDLNLDDLEKEEFMEKIQELRREEHGV